MSSRLFDQHLVRRVDSLDGVWDVHFPKQGTTIEPKRWRSGVGAVLDIPGVWEQLEERVNYRGQAVFRRRFTAPASGPARLVCKGVSHTARVLLDGKEVGGHHNAFTASVIDIPRLKAGDHELLIHVSNEHGEISALHVPNDYYNYGGISRPIEIQFLATPVFIESVQVTPKLVRGNWQARCRALVHNLGTKTLDTTLQLELAGASRRKTVAAAPGETVVEFNLKPEQVEPWCPARPRLYLLEAALLADEQVIDDWRDRIGFRSVQTKGSQILLNGEPLLMLGFNRHEDHADYGCAIPLPIMRKDLAQFKDMGCNAVRTCHYPNDERFLDLCDELGFVVWEENHARGLGIGDMRHPRFREQAYACTREMVHQHINRPSIVLWGIFNECASEDTYGRELYAENFALIESMDPSRPTTYASCRHGNDICQDLPAVCGWNFYPCWYGQNAAEGQVEEIVKRYRNKGMGNKPLIISETGAGALPGFHDPVRRGKWSEERQADILDELCAAYASHKRLAGLFLWQYCDVRVDEAWAIRRPRTMNNKGVVDEHRRHKLAYAVVKEHYTKVLAAWPNQDVTLKS